MTVDELRKKYRCTEKDCTMRDPLVQIFQMVHAIDALLEGWSDAEVAVIISLVENLQKVFSRVNVAHIAAASSNLNKLQLVPIASAIAAFEIVRRDAEISAAALGYVQGFRRHKCEGPIQ
jgi:hypothetical protein